MPQLPLTHQRIMREKLVHIRVSLSDANAFVRAHHRHHRPVIGHLFSLGAVFCGNLVGISIVGRPVSRMRDDGLTAEVTRLCTDGTRNACSFLYGASARAVFALGFQRIGTYILASENGASLNASGWRLIGQTAGGSWSRDERPRADKHPLEPKTLFEIWSPHQASTTALQNGLETPENASGTTMETGGNPALL